MKRNLYRLTLAVLLLGAFAAAQTPQQNYPNESQPSATPSIQQQQRPNTQPQPSLPQTKTAPGEDQPQPGDNPITPNTQALPQSDQQLNSHVANSDDAMKTRLNRVLAANPRLSDVQAVVSAGQVTLTGTVASESDRADAKRAVEESAGVNSVTDEITIGTPTHLPPDASNQAGASSLPQSDVSGKQSSAQSAAHGCECPKGQPNGTYPGTDQPCACSGTNTHSGESLPNQPAGKPVPPM